MTSQEPPLSSASLSRSQRPIVLLDIGGACEQKLKAFIVLIIGGGGLGHQMSQYLASAGVGPWRLVDAASFALYT